MSRIKRSDKYDFFKGGDNNNGPKFKKSKKEHMKQIFKWVKVVFYVFLLGLSLTGCIQSLAIRSSSIAGSGIEFYKSKNEIAPFVSTYQIKTTKDKDGNIIEHSLISLPKDNFLVNNPEEIKVFIEQLKLNNKEFYGQYGNHSSALRIINENGESIDTNNFEQKSDSQIVTGNNKANRFIILNDYYLNALNESSTETYEYANDIIKIPFFVAKRPDNKPDIEDKDNSVSKYNLPSPAIGANAFQAFRKENDGSYSLVKIDEKSGKYLAADGKTEINPNTPEGQKEIQAFKYKFQFEKIYLEVKVPVEIYSSEAYARDYLQSLLNVFIQFKQFELFEQTLPNSTINLNSEKENKSSIQTRFENLSKIESNTFSSVDSNNNLTVEESNKLFSFEQKNAMEKYQTQISPLIGSTGFGIKKLKLDDSENPDAWATPYQFDFLTDKNSKHSFLLNGSTEPQKPIINWSDAWGLGPFYGLVVYPIAFVVNSLSHSIPAMAGWGSVISIAVAVIVARLFTFLVTYKSAFAQSKQANLAPKKAKIDAKYADFKGNKVMEQRKRQEISELYKKNNINMLTPILSALISMPIFLAMWRVIQGIPILKSTDWLGINFSSLSYQELFSGAWQYLPLMIVAVLIQAGSQLVPRLLNKKRMSERANVAEKAALKKANKTQNIMMGVFIFMALIFEAGIQIYWIVGGIWMMLQSLMIHHIQKTKIFKEKLIKYV
ncbi:MAG: membrane protein insertase YidC [Metamycoplasmataceae bacterium]